MQYLTQLDPQRSYLLIFYNNIQVIINVLFFLDIHSNAFFPQFPEMFHIYIYIYSSFTANQLDHHKKVQYQDHHLLLQH